MFLSMLVVAMPLKGVMLSYRDTASARQVKGEVARRGLCGDVYLWSDASRSPHQRREGGHVRAQGGDHRRRGA